MGGSVRATGFRRWLRLLRRAATRARRRTDPRGTYWLDSRQLIDLQERWFYGLFYETGWGTDPITIHPFTTTETYGRGGFFIHGGTSPGSAGCVDLTSNMASFARRLAAYAPRNEGRVCGPSATPHKVKLHVQYSTAYYGRGAELREIESRIVGPPGRREYIGAGGGRVPEY